MEIRNRRVVIVRSRVLPYSIGAPPGLPAIMFAMIAFLSMGVVPIFAAGDNPRSKVEWFATLLLGIFLFQFLSVLTKNVTFGSENIEYRRFFMRRKYRYDELRSIFRTFKLNLVMRFAFFDGTGFTLDANFIDLDFLAEILNERAPMAAASLSSLR